MCEYVSGEWSAEDGRAYEQLESKIEEAFPGRADEVHRVSYVRRFPTLLPSTPAHIVSAKGASSPVSLSLPSNKQLAIPPQYFAVTARHLRTYNYSSGAGGPASEGGGGAINRLCVEKPLGRDSESCEVLLGQLGQSWDLESEVFLVDHILGEGMCVEGILQTR